MRTANRAVPSTVMATRWPGVVLAAVVAGAASAIGVAAPTIGAPVIAIVLGALLGAVIGRRRRSFEPGLRLSSAWPLQCAVALTGWQLSLGRVVATGAGSFPIMLGTLAACFVATAVLGRWLGVPTDLRTLIGVGTGICGASAIAAVSPVIRARASVISYAVTTIFVFNVAAVLVFPPLGHALGMSQHAFGLFAGTAVNDTSSVVATATTYGSTAVSDAVVVKLTRVLMIIPVTIVLAAVTARRGRGDTRPSPLRLVPWFLIAFLVLAAVNSFWAAPASAHHAVRMASGFLIAMALAAIGLSTDLSGIRRAGVKPLILGAALWFTVAATSLALQTIPM